MAPVERRPHRLLADRQIVGASGQHWQALLHARQQCRRREDLHTIRGKLDRQWQTVEPGYYRGDLSRVVGRQRKT